MKMFTYLLYFMEILVEGEAVKRYNRQTKDIEKKNSTLALDLNFPNRTFLPLKVITEKTQLPVESIFVTIRVFKNITEIQAVNNDVGVILKKLLR